jgi:hypothetical protein
VGQGAAEALPALLPEPLPVKAAGEGEEEAVAAGPEAVAVAEAWKGVGVAPEVAVAARAGLLEGVTLPEALAPQMLGLAWAVALARALVLALPVAARDCVAGAVAYAVGLKAHVLEACALALRGGLGVAVGAPLPLPAALPLLAAVGLCGALGVAEPLGLLPLPPPALPLAAAVALAGEGLCVAKELGEAVELAPKLRVATAEGEAGLLGLVAALTVPEGLRALVALALALGLALTDPTTPEALAWAVPGGVAVAALPEAVPISEAEAQ